MFGSAVFVFFSTNVGKNHRSYNGILEKSGLKMIQITVISIRTASLMIRIAHSSSDQTSDTRFGYRISDQSQLSDSSQKSVW